MLIFSFPAQILPFAHAFGRILNYIFRKTIYISVLIGLCVSLLLYKTGKTAVIRLHVREHYALIVGGIMHVQFSGSESLKRFYACAAVDLHAEHIYFALYGAVLIPDLIDRILEFSRVSAYKNHAYEKEPHYYGGHDQSPQNGKSHYDIPFRFS